MQEWFHPLDCKQIAWYLQHIKYLEYLSRVIVFSQTTFFGRNRILNKN